MRGVGQRFAAARLGLQPSHRCRSGAPDARQPPQSVIPLPRPACRPGTPISGAPWDSGAFQGTFARPASSYPDSPPGFGFAPTLSRRFAHARLLPLLAARCRCRHRRRPRLHHAERRPEGPGRLPRRQGDLHPRLGLDRVRRQERRPVARRLVRRDRHPARHLRHRPRPRRLAGELARRSPSPRPPAAADRRGAAPARCLGLPRDDRQPHGPHLVVRVRPVLPRPARSAVAPTCASA